MFSFVALGTSQGHLELVSNETTANAFAHECLYFRAPPQRKCPKAVASTGGASEKISPFWGSIARNLLQKLPFVVHYSEILTKYPNPLICDLWNSPEFINLRPWRRAQIYYDDSLTYPPSRPYPECLVMPSPQHTKTVLQK